ncbi:MAG: peptidoglycan-binding protein [Micavibrio sp.]
MSGSARKTGDAQTAQVVTLLNQLGERIVRSEHERLAVREEIESTREILSSLENRAEKTERIFLTMQDNIFKKESVAEQLIERQNNLERLYQDSAERLKRAEALTGQIEEAIALQNRLARRLEKTAQDKIRILSKIERIEAAVEETRMSLNSGALVGISVPQPPANDPAKLVVENRPWWARSYKTQAAVLTSLIIGGLLGGVAISQLVAHWPQTAVMVAEKSGPQTTGDDYVSPYETKVSEVAPAAAESVSTDQSSLAPYGEDTLLAGMDSDPDSVAATLNNIEPSVSNVTVETGVINVTRALEEIPEPQPVSLTVDTEPKEALAQPADTGIAVDAFVKAQSDQSKPLTDRITADSALPDVIKKIEAKAFEGVPEAQHDLAAIYTAGHGGVEVDYKRAAQWFSEAAANGVANARYNLGVLYHQGLGVDRDISKAIGWYRAAAEIGHPEADYNLGIAAIEGIGTEYNPRQAANFFEKAARGGVMEAAYNLGLIHENGLLGDADMNEAVFWYGTASNHNPEARVALDQVVKALSLKSGDVERIMQEYGAIYKLSEPATVRKADVKTESAVTEMASVATLTPEDQASPNDPAVLAKVIPPLSSDDTANLLNSVRKDQAMIAQIQEQLIRLGLYPGPADGLGGPQTEDAIRSYQAKNSLEVTGKPSEDLLVRMLTSELNAASGSVIQ